MEGIETKEELEFNRKSKEYALRQAERKLNDHFQLFKDNLAYQVQKWRFEDWLLKTHGVVERKEYRRLYTYNFHRFKYKLC